jgi:glucose-1-phosphate thymidylyltransferase
VGEDLRGLVLAGGTGSRLRPLTYTRSKQLLPVANRPILFYAIEALVAAGITEVGVVVGDTAREIEAALGDGSALGCRITYVPQERPLGLAHAVLTAEPFLKHHPFLMYLGDNLLKGGVTGFCERFRRSDWDSAILLTPVDHPERFGVAEMAGERVVRLTEKPAHPPSNLALVGVYLFRPVIFDAVRSLRPSARGEYEITDALQRLVDDGRAVHAERVEGWWKDTGKPEDLLEANRLVLEDLAPEIDTKASVDDESHVSGRVRLAADVVIRRSTVRGPVVIGPGTVVEDAFVGPFTSVGPRVQIVRTEIENSIVLADAVLDDVPGRIDGSLLGQGTRVSRRRAAPHALTLVTGDHCLVEVL